LDHEVVTPPDETPPPPPPERKGGGALHFLKELPVLIALALGIALLIKAFLVQAFYIPSASMEPTLRQGDRVLVNKLSYRFGKPKRGDVIVFRDPYPNPCDNKSGDGADNPGLEAPTTCNRGIAHKILNWFAEVFGLPTGDTRDFIKRIVALPGETVALQNGDVYVCDQPKCRPVDSKGQPLDGHLVTFAHTATKGPQKDDDTVKAFHVPEGQFWVLGDNRANSSDSRVFHSIKRKTIIGKAFVVVWPPNRFTGL
jgi:signal peptidase I